MATKAEIASSSREHDARVLEDAARIIRRRKPDYPAGVSLDLFCRILTTEAAVLRSEARTYRG